MLSSSTEKKKQLVPGGYKGKENPEPVESKRAVHWCGIKKTLFCAGMQLANQDWERQAGPINGFPCQNS